jgi:predicted ribosome quality control (RQC) complex YloA/Tae2 family protein
MIPFDALSLAAIADEIKVIVGAKVQGIRQPNPTTIVVELYHRGTAHQLLVCCHPEFFRVHFVTQRPRNSGEPPVFCATLRARLDGQTLESVVMKHSDRVLVLDFNGHKLIAELMGKHSNLIFIDQENRILSAAKWVREAQSSRPILPNTAYLWPPVLDASKPDLTEFTKPLVHSKYKRIGELWNPGYSLKDGAYPVSLSDQFSTWLNRDTFSLALEQAYRERIHSHEFNTAQRSLIAQLESAILAREVAIQELQEAIEMGGRAGQWQRQAELLMAYAANLPSGSTKTTLPDYDGTPLEIKLNSEQTGKENSLRLFERAKKAKGRIGVLQDQLVRLKAIKYDLDRYLLRALESTTKTALEECQTEIKERRLLLTQTHRSPNGKQVKPFEGHRIRELVGPKNHRILYGENAEANDYLTLRIGKSNDWWLHVRGHTSAHVLVPTSNKPELTPREVLEFAAKIAVQNSNQKHAGFVAVDYTLKKHVRRTKGSPKGSVIYTHEKTLHVEG